MSCRDLIRSVSDAYLIAARYQVPWSLLMRTLGEIGASAAAPLFNYLNLEGLDTSTSVPQQQPPSLKIEPLSVPGRDDVISVDWKAHEFTVSDSGKELLVAIKYLPSRCDPAVVGRFHDVLLRFLDAIADDPKQSLGRLWA